MTLANTGKKEHAVRQMEKIGRHLKLAGFGS